MVFSILWGYSSAFNVLIFVITFILYSKILILGCDFEPADISCFE